MHLLRLLQLLLLLLRLLLRLGLLEESTRGQLLQLRWVQDLPRGGSERNDLRRLPPVLHLRLRDPNLSRRCAYLLLQPLLWLLGLNLLGLVLGLLQDLLQLLMDVARRIERLPGACHLIRRR